eukprot:TRINITY_DN8735_c1_g1_i1.p1 TRINITY_DN8735_c1_g1~~TRINITY_DN8735_c1_g1_i1.p1  ORF type:complete len:250 (+),score=65.84 TRINITY_DN8735_c1_g1_i1:120-869(+)
MASSSVMMRINREIRDLQKGEMEGIYPVFNEENILEVQAFIQGPVNTPFEGAFFKVSLHLGSDFPAAPPKGLFLTKIFHPNVSAKGEICVNTLKKDWRPDVGLRQVLLTIKCLLMMPNPESALNEEAGMLLLEDYDGYFRRAKLMTSIHGIKSLPNGLAPSTTLSQSHSTNDASVNDASDENVATENDVDAQRGSSSSSSSTTTTTSSLTSTSTSTSTSSAAAIAAKKTKETAEADKKKLEKKRSLKRL